MMRNDLFLDTIKLKLSYRHLLISLITYDLINSSLKPGRDHSQKSLI